MPTILLFAALASTLIGTGESADVASIQRGLPDIYRLLRAVTNFSIFFISLGGIINNPLRWRYAGSGAKWMLIYAMFAVASTLWSIYPFITLWKSFEVLNLVLLAIYLSGYLQKIEDVRWLFNIAFLFGLYILMTVYVGAIVYPREGLLSINPLTGRGYFGVKGLVPNFNPSSVGVLAAVVAVYAIVPILMRFKADARYRNRLGSWVLVILSVVLLLLCRSRTQMIAFAVSLICLLFFSRRYVLASSLVGIGTTAFIVSELVIKYFLRGQSFDQFAAFTGRLAWWTKAIKIGLEEAPLLGKGFYAAQRVTFHSNVLDSTYVEVFFGLGFIGLVLLVMPLLIMTLSLLRSRPKNSKFTHRDLVWMQCMGIFIVLAVRSITVSTFVSMHVMLVYYLILQISSAALQRTRYMQSAPEQSVSGESINPKDNRILHRVESVNDT